MTPDPTSGDMLARRWLAGILLSAFVVRVIIAIALPTSAYPDEIFQTREAAHRLVYGYGIVPWEFREGIRNWIFPAFLAAIMRASAWMRPGSLGYTLGIALTLSALSLTVVWVGFRWAYRIAGLSAAIITAIICAAWYDLIFFAPQALTEVAAAYLMLPGLYLGYFADHPDSDSGVHSQRALFLAGICLGLAVALRVHLAPAVFVAMLWLCGWEWRRWLAMCAGMAAPVAVFGAVDAFTWGYPFASYWNSITVNVFHHKSNIYGKEPWSWYFVALAHFFGPAIVLVVFGVRRACFLMVMVAAVIATHMMFPHKEYRFIFPAVALLCILMGLGLSAILAWRPIANASHPRRAVAEAAIFMILVSVWWGQNHGLWRLQAGKIRAFEQLSLRDDVCGIGVMHWAVDSGGYFYLHHDVPLFMLANQFPSDVRNFNYIGSNGFDVKQYPDYSLQGCWSGYCVYRRPGGCTPMPGYSINELLRELNR